MSGDDILNRSMRPIAMTSSRSWLSSEAKQKKGREASFPTPFDLSVLPATAAGSTAATAAAATATAAVTTAAAATTAATRRSLFARSGFVNGEGSAVEGRTVLVGDRRLNLIRIHVDERETAALDDANVGGAVSSERLGERSLRARVGNVPHVQCLICQFRPPSCGHSRSAEFCLSFLTTIY